MPRGVHDYLVTYDVSTETKEGRRRLRKVAQACSAFGQRVQNSVFECRLTGAQVEELEARLLTIVALDEDRLRLYQLPSDRSRIRIHGIPLTYDIRETLIV